MAEAFPETPMVGAPSANGWAGRPTNFFPDSLRTAEARRAQSTSNQDPSAGSEAMEWKEYVVVDGGSDEDEVAAEVRAGRLDTLGWVSASWESRCVILRTDGSMSVQPLGLRRRPAAGAGARPADSVGSLASTSWSHIVKLRGRSGAWTSTTAKTDGLTSWASNSSNGSSNQRGGALARLPSGFMASNGGSAAHGNGGSSGNNRASSSSSGIGNGRDHVDESPVSSVASTTGSLEKGKADTGSKLVRGLKLLSSSRRINTDAVEGSVGFGEREEGGREELIGADEDDDPEEDDADDIDLSEWEVSRLGRGASNEGRYVVQLRQPATGSFLLIGTSDPLLYEEWVADVLYVQQRTLALEWNKRFRSRVAKMFSPSPSALAVLPDRDWHREWEAACSLTGNGRGGRDVRVTIALQQHFRAFASAVAGAFVRMSPQEQTDWQALKPLEPMLAENEDGEGTASVRRLLSDATPKGCSTFLSGNVAFVLAPRGSGSGFKTHKRLGAELKGAQILRRAVERRVLGGVSGGGGGGGPGVVNALAPLTCVLDVHGCRATAIALPAFQPRSRATKRLQRVPTQTLGTIEWRFAELRGRAGDGQQAGDKIRCNDVRELISEHLGLSSAEEPRLSFTEGVLPGNGKPRQSPDGDGGKVRPPVTMVIAPDLLPAEDIPSRLRACPGTPSPEAAWGVADAIRAVIIPQDLEDQVRVVKTLDLAVAAAAIAAEAAEEAANLHELDRYPPVRPVSHKGGGEGSGGGGGDAETVGGEGVAAAAAAEDDAAPNVAIPARGDLVVEAVRALLQCDRDSVLKAEVRAHGFDLFSKRQPAGLPLSRSQSATSASGGLGKLLDQVAGLRPHGGYLGVNERATCLCGRKVYGDAVVVLVGGGVLHGAAGAGVIDDDDDTTSRQREHNPLRLREELLRLRSRFDMSRGSDGRAESGGDAVPAAGDKGGSALIVQKLLPELTGRIASDALVGGSQMLGQEEDRNPPLFLFEGGHLCAAVHGAGINLRYLPMIRRSLGWAHEGTRQLIAAEILGRTAKHILACRLRLCYMTRGGSEEPLPSPSLEEERLRAAARLLLNAVLFRTYASEESKESIGDDTSSSWKGSLLSVPGSNAADAEDKTNVYHLSEGSEILLQPLQAVPMEDRPGEASPKPPPLSRLSEGEQKQNARSRRRLSVSDKQSSRRSAFSSNRSGSVTSPQLPPNGRDVDEAGGDGRALVLTMAEEAALFWEVESRLWLLLGPFGSAGGLALPEDEAFSRMHICRGLSGVHLLPSLTRNLGIVLTARALRKIQESGVVNRIKFSHVDTRSGGPPALGSARFKGLGEEAAAVKRRLREKCRRRWVATRSSASVRGIGWTGSSAEQRAEYAAVAEDVLGGFVDAGDRGQDVAYARREIAEAHVSVAVADWAEGNSRSAKREAERALRALLEGKLGYLDKDEAFRVEQLEQGTKAAARGASATGVPVPLGLCLAATAMLLVASMAADGGSGEMSTTGPPSNGSGVDRMDELSEKDKEEVMVWLWRVLQVNFPAASSTLSTPSGPRDVPLWGAHPLAPAIACVLAGKTADELTKDKISLRLGRPRRGRGALFMDWLSNQLNTGPFPINHLCSIVGRGNGGHRSAGGGVSLGPADAVVKLVSLLLKGERGFVERWFKVSSSYAGGTLELLTPPDTFSWLLASPPPRTAVGGLAATEPATTPRIFSKQVGGTAEALRQCTRAGAGRLYVDGKVTGFSAEDMMEQQRLQEDEGQASDGALKLLPVRIPTEWRVIQVSCGFRHTALVTARGLVLTMGHGETGRLGHGDEEDVLQPKVVSALADDGDLVIWAACGREHTLVALAAGGVYSWGWGEGGRLGLGEVDAVLTPRRVTEFDNLGVKIKRVGCGREHSLAVSDAGRVYAFGPSDGGRLGFPAVKGSRGVSAPRILRASCLAEERIVTVAGGEMHSACVSESGKVFTWGHGNTGALGQGTAEDQPTPGAVAPFGQPGSAATADEDLSAVGIACGAWHTLVLTASGKVFAFGDGYTGQLGLEDRGDETESRALAPCPVRIERNAGGAGGAPGDVRITQVACGSFSSAVVSAEGNIYHWGKPDASMNDNPVTDRRYLLPRRVTSGRGGAAPSYRLVGQGGIFSVGIADGVRTDPRGAVGLSRGDGGGDGGGAGVGGEGGDTLLSASRLRAHLRRS